MNVPDPAVPPRSAAPPPPPPPPRPVTAPVMRVGGRFEPLRTDPPPRLFATWWLRYMLTLAQFVGIAVVLLHEYAGGWRTDDGVAPVVIAPYVITAVLLVAWSGLAMIDAARLVPATRYQSPSRASVAVAAWLLAFAAPAAAAVVIRRAQQGFADENVDDLAVTFGAAVAVAVCFLVVWLPFRYHARQAHRIGAPGRIVTAWFWLPLVTAVGAVALYAIGLHDSLAEDGLTDVERTLQVGVVFGLPALVFALSTWRALTVFDEVIELRWARWKTEWEQTLVAMAAQPPPAPEPAL